MPWALQIRLLIEVDKFFCQMHMYVVFQKPRNRSVTARSMFQIVLFVMPKSPSSS